MKSPIELLKSLLSDIRRLSDAKGTKRDVITLSHRFEHEGYGFLAVVLPTLGRALEVGLATGRFTCPPNFKKVRGGEIPRLFSGILCEVFDAYSGELKHNAVPTAVKDLRQILFLFKKLPTEPAETASLDRITKEAFVRDERAVVQNFPELQSYVVRRVSQLVLSGLHSFDGQELEHRHGPGSVYDGETTNQKWSAVCEGATQGSFDIESNGFVPWVFMVGGLDSLSSPPLIQGETPSSQNRRGHASRGVARLVTVPKTVTSLRTITVEPVVNQFLQQGLNRVLRDCISRCPILSKSLALADQSKNQHLAKVGSQTGEYATLDLKSASDLLSCRLVELIFGPFPSFLEMVLECRTPYVEIDGRQLRLRKFAGMGNALTFPVQSVVFAIIAIAADLHERGRRITRRNVLASSRSIRVFGDDIIVRTDTVHRVIAWLEDFGLKVNTTKSFVTGRFRESCGADWFEGVDVTPFYLKVRPDGFVKDAKSIKSLTEFSNHMWLSGYYEISTSVREIVEEALGRRLPLVSRRSEGLGWHTHRDVRESSHWNRELHRPEIMTYVIRSRKRKDILDGYPALLKSLTTSLIERDGKHLLETSVRYKAYLTRRRVAA